jgi:Reverse transcriptase (RNA-dependent DNA polymerase)
MDAELESQILEEFEVDDSYEKAINAPRPKRKRKANIRYAEFQCYIAKELQKEKWENEKPIPKTLKQALQGPDNVKWKEALGIEFKALINNDTWTLTRLPEGQKCLGTHWVFDIKYLATGEVERYKARLVVNGSSETATVDAVFAPVVKLESLRLIMSIAAIKGLHVHQMDVSTAFLNGEVDTDIYVRQPPGFGDGSGRVCKLKKSLYGTRTAPRIWYEVLHEFLVSCGFTRSLRDYCVYVKGKGDDAIYVAVYVDDLTIAAASMTSINQLKAKLCQRFKMRDLGDIHYLLKMEVYHDRERKLVALSQRKYINDLVKEHNLEHCTPVDTPQAIGTVLEPGEKLTPDIEKKLNLPYRRIVGELQYLVRGSRPDIANAVRELSKFLSCYNKSHLHAAKRVLKYLKGTSTYGLVFDGMDANVSYILYTDASFASKLDDRKSVTGYCVTIAGACISWKSAAQNGVVLPKQN